MFRSTAYSRTSNNTIHKLCLGGAFFIVAIHIPNEKATILKEELIKKGEEAYKSGQALNEELKHNIKEKVKETNLKYQQAQEAILEEGASLEELNQYFENTFLNEISVKDYEFIHNDIGFKGGSLGGQFNALKGIKTIYDMYALGGISVLDKDLLIEAVLNSGPDSVLMTRSPGVIDSVKNFLLGGAILAMLDAGFSQTTKFLSDLTSQYTIIPKTLELYQFGPLYIPASYVLQKVVEGLTEIGAQIEIETDNVKLSSSIEFSGQMTYNDINFNLTPSAARWNDISKRAQENTKIYVLLAAGLLDLFENLPEILVSKLDF